ncbi:MAG: type IV pilus modification protein PilV [Gammaproteobacteria bacterium]|nr:MAG: type IV pilus modification protein PilV [Gammaproteobacteria bacterium]
MNITRKNEGFGLIEVLVSLLVVTIGIMGLISLQLNTMQSNQASSYRSLAVWAASDILDRMRANREAALNAEYDIASGDDAPDDAVTIAEQDLSEWLTGLDNWLPVGDGAISVDPTTSEVTVTIEWDESMKRDGTDTEQFVFGTQI